MLERDRNFERGDEVVVEITGVTDRGLGSAQIEALVGPQRDRKTFNLFVRKALPGDKVRVVIDYARRTRCSGYWTELLKPSPLRILPRCPHFGRREFSKKGCGGCSYQSMSYRHQLAIKEKKIKEKFIDVGLDPGLVWPVQGLDEPWYYRNRMDFNFGDTVDNEFALGFHPTGYRFEVINIETCFLLSEFASDFVPQLRKWGSEQGLEPVLNRRGGGGWLLTLMIREGKRTGERLVELMTTDEKTTSFDGEEMASEEVARRFCTFMHDSAAQFGEEITSVYWTQRRQKKGESTRWTQHHLAGRETLCEELHLADGRELRFEIHPRAFFQTNTRGAERLYDLVIEKAGLSDKPVNRAVDLYCGTGTIALCLAPYAREVLGVEMQPDAVENARRNARLNGVDNVEFLTGCVRHVLKKRELGAIDLTVVDPPRGGLLPGAVEEILLIDAPTLVYVSCNPASLARDLCELTAAGYQLHSVQPLDLFPHTFHVECVALLRK